MARTQSPQHMCCCFHLDCLNNSHWSQKQVESTGRDRRSCQLKSVDREFEVLISSPETQTLPKRVEPARKAKGTLGRGSARLSVAGAGSRSYLDTRYFSDPFRIFTPRSAPGEPLSLVSSTLSGGLVGGDQLRFSLEVKPEAAVQVVTQWLSSKHLRRLATAQVVSGAGTN